MVVSVAACQGTDDAVEGLQDRSGADIQAYLDALPSARVIDVDDFAIPTFVTGRLGRLEIAADVADTDMSAALEAIAPVFRASPADLVLHRAYTDNIGDQHFRYRQTRNGLDVIGGEIILHVRDGLIYAANGNARGDLDVADEAEIDVTTAIDLARAASVSVGGVGIKGEPVLAYRLAGDRMDLVFLVDVTGEQDDGTPLWDTVLVNAVDGSIVDRMPHIHEAKNRAVYSANNGTSLPGTLKRSEGGAASTDSTVNASYDNFGWTYDCYKNLFGRDSFNNAGAQMKSTVHYSNNYCNAFWNGSQMVFGDGNASQGCGNLAISMDVTAHELTHAVTQYESNLTYSGESGGLNESMSDVFGAVCELYKAGNNATATTLTAAPNSNTWKIGEEILPPYLRLMNDPVADGASKDLWYSGVGSVDVHYSSGISNLAFYLLSQGGTHPRGKTTVNVTGIGVNKAAQIFYRANRDLMSASTNFAGAKTATEQAASQLGYTAAEQASVTAAWNAVGVGSSAPPPSTVVLSNGVPVNSISDSTGGQKTYSLVVPSGATSLSFQISGGSGDADLYVKFGSLPTSSSYDCRPYLGGNAETCTITNIQAGTYYVMLNAYSSYSGVSLVGTYATGGGGGTCGGTVLCDGTPVTGISGSSGSTKNYTMNVPAGKSTLSFQISGGTGDADMYVKFGSAPTTSSYNCRPYLNGNNETCTFNNPSGGTWYVMLRGYTSYSGVSLVGDHP